MKIWRLFKKSSQNKLDYEKLSRITTGTNCTSFGIPSAYRNIAIGPHAGGNLTLGSYNILLGDGAGKDLTTENYQFILVTDLGTIRKTMTHEQYEVISSMLMGAILSWDTSYAHTDPANPPVH